MSAKATGAQPQPQPNGTANNNSNTKHRAHHDNSANRAFTEEQKAAVIRIKKCPHTAFYDILGLESEKKTVTDAGIKKAYRKLSLLTHPDKNGYPGSDDAFKMVSRAFQVLSDADKKKQFDQFGVDPDNRFASASAASPFSNFARSPGARRGPMFEEEISPEELFRQFFGGGSGFGGPFGGGLFDTGPGMVFSMGGGPGIRVHQFGGNRPRRRPPGARPTQEEATPTALGALTNLLPLLILFIIPLFSSLFSSSDSSYTSTSPFSSPFSSRNVPTFDISDKPSPPLTSQQHTLRLNIPYFVNPTDIADWGAHVASSSPFAGGRSSNKKWRNLDEAVETKMLQRLNYDCAFEERSRERLRQEAIGWFSDDEEKLRKAREMEMRSCKYLAKLRGMVYY